MEPNCNKCKHYFITFDKHASKGCKIFGIKSNMLPSLVVKQANNGTPCKGFELKERFKNQQKDLKNPKMW